MTITSTLKKAREIAGYSQEELAAILGIAQTQVSRYESDPDSIPFGQLKKWAGACGTTVDLLDEFVAAHLPALSIGMPYKEHDEKLNFLERFVLAAPAMPGNAPPITFQPDTLHRQVASWLGRPTILLVGKFDSGKTLIANFLLGSNKLPSQYAPATAIVTFIRHVEQRPLWQKEDVWIMRDGFDPARWRDENHCANHRIVAGSYDMLKLYGTRHSEGERQGAKSALVYMDSPILHACSIIDLPGFSDDPKRQADVINSSLKLGDIFLYTSTAQGFLGVEDRVQLSQLIRLLPSSDGSRTLERLFIVATHANNSISDEQLADLVKKGGQAFHLHAQDGVLEDVLRLPKDEMLDIVQSRLFTFWFEKPERRAELEDALTHLLSLLSKDVISRADTEICEIKNGAVLEYRAVIEAFQETFNKRQEAKAQLDEITRNEPLRQREVAESVAKAKESIVRLRQKGQKFVDDEIAPLLTTDSVEFFIKRNKYSSNEAKRGAFPKLLEDCQSLIERKLREHSEEFQKEIEKFLSDYRTVASAWEKKAYGAISIPFDVRGAFLGGAAGVGVMGALGAWAATLGNLGGYIIVAKAAGLLDALGFSVGSVSAVSFVAALGGPVTITVGLAAALFVGIKALFGDSWEKRLAKRIAKQATEVDLTGKFRQGVETYWSDTAKAFDAGVAALEASYAEYRSTLESVAGVNLSDEDSAVRITQLITDLEKLQYFFASLPWGCTS
jgi:transcriptional regulator with XRE-family HTH domain